MRDHGGCGRRGFAPREVDGTFFELIIKGDRAYASIDEVTDFRKTPGYRRQDHKWVNLHFPINQSYKEIFLIFMRTDLVIP